jgi:hypothetical protein
MARVLIWIVTIVVLGGPKIWVGILASKGKFGTTQVHQPGPPGAICRCLDSYRRPRHLLKYFLKHPQPPPWMPSSSVLRKPISRGHNNGRGCLHGSTWEMSHSFMRSAHLLFVSSSLLSLLLSPFSHPSFMYTPMATMPPRSLLYESKTDPHASREKWI